MAVILSLLLIVGVCTINLTAATDTARGMDFRPKGSSRNARFNKVHTDCQAAYDDGWVQSGAYTISPFGKEIDVFCQQTSEGGWLRRIDGSVDFYNNWHDYKNGFGDIRGEFWIGNDMLHHLTALHDTMLRVEVEYGSTSAWSEYAEFWIDSEDNKYKIHADSFSKMSTAGDSFHDTNIHVVNDGQFFSTRDVDNDKLNNDELDSCAVQHKGAWWYNGCYRSNLNGQYGGQGTQGIVWHSFNGFTSLSGARMMLKRK